VRCQKSVYSLHESRATSSILGRIAQTHTHTHTQTDTGRMSRAGERVGVEMVLRRATSRPRWCRLLRQKYAFVLFARQTDEKSIFTPHASQPRIVLGTFTIRCSKTAAGPAHGAVNWQEVEHAADWCQRFELKRFMSVAMTKISLEARTWSGFKQKAPPHKSEGNLYLVISIASRL
jgi:hypothetical protein